MLEFGLGFRELEYLNRASTTQQIKNQHSYELFQVLCT